jgi:tRNA modification GTPase
MGESTQTIAALSTPAGESGIAVIRLSGPEAFSILSSIFRSGRGSKARSRFEHQRLYHGILTAGNGQVVDEVVCAVMRAPESYTGEDIVEISCHGNTLLVRKILDLIFAKGGRAAEPGEFTKRAFLNGKMDLIQAEAVSDLIHARSELQRQVAQEQLGGGLSTRINRLADEVLTLLGTIEANIDFIEEDIDTLDMDAARALLREHQGTLDELLAGASLGKPFRDGYHVTIAGPVNAGKSSLFNRLVGETRAIVTEVPGTTRDVLREPVVLEGLLFLFQDTAGLRGTADRVESIGIGFAENAASTADIVLFVLDATEPMTEQITERFRTLPPERTLAVLNKMDLPNCISEDTLRDIRPVIATVAVSARTGVGLPELRDKLMECVGRERLNWIARERIVLNTRLVSVLREASRQVHTLERSLAARAPLEILALDAREVLTQYERATGRRYTEDLLDTIFSRFCIGK